MIKLTIKKALLFICRGKCYNFVAICIITRLIKDVFYKKRDFFISLSIQMKNTLCNKKDFLLVMRIQIN